MKASTALRLAVVAEWVLIVTGIALSFLLEDALPEPLRNYLKAEAEQEPDTGTFALWILLLGAGAGLMISSIGLLALQRWALWLSLIMTIEAYLLSVVLASPTVQHPLPEAILSVATMLGGFVLALGFFTDALLPGGSTIHAAPPATPPPPGPE